MNKVIDRPLIDKIHSLLDAGLVAGLGKAEPGKMCVEAAVCFALGEPHNDNPSCVGRAVRAFKIRLNDARWLSNKARAEGMRRLAIAQLGSDQIDQKEFARRIVLRTIQVILPIIVRANRYSEQLAIDCEQATDMQSAGKAARAVRKVAYDAAAYAAADAYAAYAAAAAYDAYAAAYAAADAYDAEPKYLTISADLAVEVLIEMGCEGTKWL